MRGQAERRCLQCGTSRPLADFDTGPYRVDTGICHFCRRGPITPAPPARPRLMQTLRHPDVTAHTDTERALVSISALIDARAWPMTDPATDGAIRRRLMAVLFAAGCHVQPGPGAPLRTKHHVHIDLAWGDTATCVAHLLTFLKSRHDRRAAVVLISQNPIAPAVVDGIERYAGVPTAVHGPQPEL